jgi:hypothetical protein
VFTLQGNRGSLLCREINSVYFEYNTKRIKTLRGRNVGGFNVEGCGICSDCCDIRG